MRKHVRPANKAATIPNPDGGDLPPEGMDVEWTAYWAGLQSRGDVVVKDVEEEAKPKRKAATKRKAKSTAPAPRAPAPTPAPAPEPAPADEPATRFDD